MANRGRGRHDASAHRVSRMTLNGRLARNLPANAGLGKKSFRPPAEVLRETAPQEGGAPNRLLMIIQARRAAGRVGGHAHRWPFDAKGQLVNEATAAANDSGSGTLPYHPGGTARQGTVLHWPAGGACGSPTATSSRARCAFASTLPWREHGAPLVERQRNYAISKEGR
jgi:hypothetical protein